MDDNQLGSSCGEDRSAAYSVMATLGEQPVEYQEVILKGVPGSQFSVNARAHTTGQTLSSSTHRMAPHTPLWMGYQLLLKA